MVIANKECPSENLKLTFFVKEIDISQTTKLNKNSNLKSPLKFEIPVSTKLMFEQALHVISSSRKTNFPILNSSIYNTITALILQPKAFRVGFIS